MIAAGDRLRDLREDKGKTQAEISVCWVQLSKSIPAMKQTGLDPASSALIKLAGYYQVSSRLYSRSNLLPEESRPEMAETIS